MSNLNLSSFLRFLLVGGTATALHYLIMWSLLHITVMGAVLASSIGFVLSAVFNYLASARFTFQHASDHKQTLPRFAVTLGAGCLINMLVLYALTRFGVSIVLSQLLATGVVLIWNYTINAVWTFRKQAV